MYGLEFGGLFLFAAAMLGAGIVMGALGGWVLFVVGRSVRRRYRNRKVLRSAFLEGEWNGAAPPQDAPRRTRSRQGGRHERRW